MQEEFSIRKMLHRLGWLWLIAIAGWTLQEKTGQRGRFFVSAASAHSNASRLLSTRHPKGRDQGILQPHSGLRAVLNTSARHPYSSGRPAPPARPSSSPARRGLRVDRVSRETSNESRCQAPVFIRPAPSPRKAALVSGEAGVAGGSGHRIAVSRGSGARGRGCGWISSFPGGPRRRFPRSALGGNSGFHPQPPPCARGGPKGPLLRPRSPARPPSCPARRGLRVDRVSGGRFS